MRPRLTYANVTATLALAAALGGGAYAATQSATTTTIRACASKRIGIIRYLPKGKKCNPRTDRTLTWNVRGPRGLRGLRGAAGAAGPAGAAGAPGQPGAPGEPGSARVYGQVSMDSVGTITVTRAKGLTAANFVRASGSVLDFCLRDLPFTPENIVGTTALGSPHVFLHASIPPTLCNSTNQADLGFYTASSSTATTGTAFILIN